MWGGNLAENRASELALMTNAAVLAVDQNSTNNRQLTGGTRPVWTADVPGTTHKYVALFNRDVATANVSVNLADLGIGSAIATDLWSGANLGTIGGTFTRSIPAHGTGLYRLVTQTTTPVPGTLTLTARHSGKLLDVFSGSTVDGADVVQWTANGQANQRWRFQDVGGGYSTVTSVNSTETLRPCGLHRSPIRAHMTENHATCSTYVRTRAVRAFSSSRTRGALMMEQRLSGVGFHQWMCR